MMDERDRLTEVIIGAAIEAHRELGPGLLESAYEACLAHELRQRGLEVERQKILPVTYKGIRIESGFRIDLLIEKQVIVPRCQGSCRLTNPGPSAAQCLRGAARSLPAAG